MKRIITLAIVIAVIIVGFNLLTPKAEAQYYGSSYESTRAALIAQINDLLARLAEIDGSNNYHGGGYSNSSVSASVSSASVERDSARIYGTVRLNGASYADVWFEYGKTKRFGDRSLSGRIDRYTSSAFQGDLYNLDHNSRYYYRAVAQDPSGRRSYSQTESFVTDFHHYGRRYDDRYYYYDDDDDRRRFDDEEPDVDTEDADDVTDSSAELNGEVDMNDYRNGLVFFVYGEDEDQVEDIEDDYDEYRDIDEDGDDLQKVRVDSDLDDDDDYWIKVTGLDDDTDYYYAICVEFEDDDDDEVIICGNVEDFETDED